ncbi:hypothetical protein BD779DRAFT_720274 [Infundibulicybe gibba]|nr:hypothetical protein BD779DRAFT_720274 [Infundibulicybe gibba]
MDIPIELLSAIFLHCLAYSIAQPKSWQLDSSNPGYFKSEEAPLVLTKICRLWRMVAQSTERLWVVLPCFGSSSISPGSDQLFRLYLNYSGKAPLSIRIVLHDSSRDVCVVNLLSLHLHRAKQLTVLDANCEHHTITRFDHLLDGLRGNFNLLTHLRFETDEELPASYPNPFEHAPLLQSVVISSLSDIKLPWSQLTHLCGGLMAQNRLSDPCASVYASDIWMLARYSTNPVITKWRYQHYILSTYANCVYGGIDVVFDSSNAFTHPASKQCVFRFLIPTFRPAGLSRAAYNNPHVLSHHCGSDPSVWMLMIYPC